MSSYKGYCTKADAAAYWKIEPLPVKKKTVEAAKQHPRSGVNNIQQFFVCLLGLTNGEAVGTA